MSPHRAHSDDMKIRRCAPDSGDASAPTRRRGKRSSDRRSGGRRRTPYDPAFHRAVTAGFLTAQEAERRGRRADFAARIALEHDLPQGLALLVADNAISVNLARRRLAEIDPAAAIVARRPRARRTTVALAAVAGGALALAVAILVIGLHHPAPSSTAIPPAVVIAGAQADDAQGSNVVTALPLWRFVRTTTDDFGLPTKLSGPDPESVLRAFCKAAPADAEVQPVGLASAIPPHPAVRWGVFRIRGDGGFVQRAIVIRHDPQTLQWTAGNGRFIVFYEEGPKMFPEVEAIDSGPITTRGSS